MVFGLALLLCTAIILGISLATGTFYGSIATVYIFLIITFSLFSRLKVGAWVVQG